MKPPIYTIKSKLPSADVRGKRVFVRADLNVDFSGNTLLNDYRLQAIRPTLDVLLSKGAKIILASHIGRPKNHEPELSTQKLVPWFEKQGYSIAFEPDLSKAQKISHRDPNTILLLENLRFFPGEKGKDPAFADSLAALADYYVDDAFGTVHRSDTSVTLLAQRFEKQNRSIGLLIEKELSMLNKLLSNPHKPFMLILGGGKVADKLPLLNALIDLVDVVALAPAIVFTFLQAQGKPVGKSLVDPESVYLCRDFLSAANKKGKTILFPVDYQIAQNSFKGQLSECDADKFPADAVGISIGPKTIELFDEQIKKAKTIVFNGLMGDPSRPQTLQGAAAIIKAMGNSDAYTVLAGGNTVGAAQQLHLEQSIDFLSTGGGATLAYLSGSPLPGLEPFI